MPRVIPVRARSVVGRRRRWVRKNPGLARRCKKKRACGLMGPKGKRIFSRGRRVYVNSKGIRYVLPTRDGRRTKLWRWNSAEVRALNDWN